AGSKGKGGSVRFAPSPPPEGAHVHFQEQLHDSAVMVTQEKDGSFLVKVGFLKILHKYEITFLLPLEQRGEGDVCALPVPNPNLRVLSVTSLPEGKVPPVFVPLVPSCPHRSPRARPRSCPCPSGKRPRWCPQGCPRGRPLSPDRHHGTPMLLDGVRCVGAELEYDSEQSDWHGFD
ncbi:CT027 protein, partial [Cephalopterus ornatus]|nr:CT027 protein [Cephalopterus ornatus]